MFGIVRNARILILVCAAFVLSSPVLAQQFLSRKIAAIGKAAPDFTLTDLSGTPRQLSSYRGKIVVIHFWSATCPFVLRYTERLHQIAEDYAGRNVVVLGIDSNADETLEQIKKTAEKRRVNYPILIDPANAVADQFGAITTPHAFIIDAEGRLVYEGSIDNQGWTEENPVTERYVRDALEALLKGEVVKRPVTETFGCTIKRSFSK